MRAANGPDVASRLAVFNLFTHFFKKNCEA